MPTEGFNITDVPNIKPDLTKQDYILRRYGEDKRPDFNNKFFNRTDESVIIELEKTILSWQKSKYFTIRVENFSVETSYEIIEDLLQRHLNDRNKKKKSKRRSELNDSDYINLKDSDTMLLIVDYYIEVFGKTGENKNKETKKNLRVLILVPRLVEDYFLKISGNLYCPTYQIIDGSIYNNSDKAESSQKREMVSFKAERPIRILRKKQTYMLYDGTPINGCVVYTCNILNTPGVVMSYFFARFGFNAALAFLGVQYISILNGLPQDIEELSSIYYVFSTKNPDIFIKVPKDLFNNDYVTQSVVGTLIINVKEDTEYIDVYTSDYWCSIIGNAKYVGRRRTATKAKTINPPNPKNGLMTLDKLESIYSLTNYELLKLPNEDKATVYHVIRWMIREFPILRGRDNIDIFYKRIRYPEYIAMKYGSKISKSILKLCEKRESNLTVDTIERAIYTKPDILLGLITRDSLKNLVNRVNDNYAFTVLKASYKGESSLGETSNKQVSTRYRNVHYSHAGVIDMTSSAAGDPGMTTLLCPLGHIEDDGFFHNYQEPNSWNETYNELLSNYEKALKLRSMIKTENKLLNNTAINTMIEDDIMVEWIEQLRSLVKPLSELENTPMDVPVCKYQLDESGMIIYEQSREDSPFLFEDSTQNY